MEHAKKYNGIALSVCRPSQNLTYLILSDITLLHTITGLNQPYGIAATTINYGQIVVTENHGSYLKSYGSVASYFDIHTYPYPRGVAVTQDNYILITIDHKICKVRFDGKVRAHVSNDREGTKPLQFNFPYGILFLLSLGYIYVADTFNDRVQVLDPNLKVLLYLITI